MADGDQKQFGGDAKQVFQTKNVPHPEKPKKGTTPPKPAPKAPIAPNQYISLYAEDFNDSTHNTQIAVLAGDSPPKLAGGLAKQAIVDRPLHRGITVFQGYDPVSLEIPFRFVVFDENGWRKDNVAGARMEHDIEQLEWMAGYSLTDGPPPLVWLATFDVNGNTNALIPFTYQEYAGPGVGKNGVLTLHGEVITAGASGAGVGGYGTGPGPWVVQAVEWDENPIRNRQGYRVRQDVKVTFLEYTVVGAGASSASRNNPKNSHKAKVFTVTAAANTPLKIARAVGARDPGALAHAIGTWPANKKFHIRSRNQKLKVGDRIQVPINYG